MIFHGNRFTLKKDVTPEQFEEAAEHLRNQGRIPAVKSFVVGREHGTDYEWAAVFVLEDLDAYWHYLIHPNHVASERFGLPLIERFQSYDITDDLDPDFAAKVEELQRRNFEADPELAGMMANLPSHLGSSSVPRSN